jgi:hypothetical protein
MKEFHQTDENNEIVLTHPTPYIEAETTSNSVLHAGSTNRVSIL